MIASIPTRNYVFKWSTKHSWSDNISAVYNYLDDCIGVQHLFDTASLHSSLFTSSAPIQNSDKFDLRTTHINLVQNNTEIIDRHKNWNTLLFEEALKIKELNPILNSGSKASKELQLFWIDGETLYTLNCLTFS